MVEGKNIVIGVTGGIAAYKACDLVSRLRKLGANVHVIMTESAAAFVSAQTFQALSQNAVVTSLFQSIKYWEIEHISLSQKADLMLIAPATANVIGKIASGIADDFLTTAVMATTAPVFLAPAMNTKMYDNPIVQENIRRLIHHGYRFIDPGEGLLACGDIGKGKMAEVETIEETIVDYFTGNDELKGVSVLVTAGPTIESIDPVRYVTNHSSGKMGYALAKAAFLSGAKVTLISGPVNLTPPRGCEFHQVTTTLEMYEKVMALFDSQQVVIKTAAVSDYRPEIKELQKIKKSDEDMYIKLVRNPDILLELGRTKKNQLLVGFAAETENVIQNAREKLERKKLDMIVANDVSQEDAGFKHDTNQVLVFKSNGEYQEISLSSKEVIARRIICDIADLLKEKALAEKDRR